jgi:hypothetical protein
MSAKALTDAQCFHAYRLAARQVREASIIDTGRGVSIGAALDERGTLVPTYDLLDREPFRSLAMSLRLIYANDEAGNFGRVANRLCATKDPTLIAAVDSVRTRYNHAINGGTFRFNLHGDFEGTAVGPREVFESWLYHGSFHTDFDRQGLYEELSRFGQNFVFAVQSVGLQMSGPIMDLDDIVADFVGEPRVPRIGANSSGTA